tara:strand:+ start:5130 stop:5537 length:408 start_codon:yes stop_codon:yes gene_type:complete
MGDVPGVQSGVHTVGIQSCATDGVANAYRFGWFDTRVGRAGIAVATDPTVEIVCGITQDTALAGEPVLIGISGLCKVEAGAAITAGQNLSCDTQGRAVAATSGDYATGIAVESAAAAGDFLRIIFSPACAGLKHA